MTTQTEALKLALEALEKLVRFESDSWELGSCRVAGRAIATIKEALAQPERHELQAKGEHPAPCARFCEANAFQIEIRRLKAQLEQPEQEPTNLERHERNVQKFLGTQQPKEPEQEPVAIHQYQMGDGSWIDQAKHSYDYNKRYAPNATVRIVYTAPPQRTWVGLTDDEFQLIYDMGRTPAGMMEMVGAKLKEKNNA